MTLEEKIKNLEKVQDEIFTALDELCKIIENDGSSLIFSSEYDNAISIISKKD